jgi:ATP adenylyltransferase
VARPRRLLWAPWRLEYVRGPKAEGCVFCRALAAGNDRENLVVHRGRAVFVMLNRYPYNAGHLMVLPCRHVASPEEFTAAEASEFWETLVRCKQALDAFMGPQGYNVGLNLGKVAGAGLADHLHLHVVPRWAGDTNFMPVVGDVHVVSQHLFQVYDGLAARLSTGSARARKRPGAKE